MATMTMEMPYQMHELDVAEGKVARVDAGLTFSQKMNLVLQVFFSLVHLTGAFRDAVQEQAKVIDVLQRPEAQELAPEQFAELAERVERLVDLNERMIPNARLIGFRPWHAYLAQLEDQSEHLAGIAETFRTACDEEELAILAGMAGEIEADYTHSDCLDVREESVGSVHA
ncbi:MAG: hypothetical protein ACLPXT_13590 [Terracidiphilus sp.]